MSKAKNRAARFLIAGLAAAALLYLGALLGNYARNYSELATLVPWHRAYLLRVMIDSHVKNGADAADYAMFPDYRECQNFLHKLGDDFQRDVRRGAS